MILEPLLKVDSVYKYFGGVRAVDGVSFELREGERLFIVGPNGAGKTTLVNLISGYLKPDKGSIIFKGVDVTRLGLAERVKLGIVRSFQFVTVFDKLTVAENIAVAVASRLGRNWVMYRRLDSYEDVMDEVEGILKLFDLDKVADRYPTEISQGDRKLLDVALALALKPSLIILDEPTSGVSTKEKHEIMGRLIRVLDATSVTSIIVEHDMDLVFRNATRVIVMNEGRILADGHPEEVRRREDVKAVLLGEARA